MVDLCRSAIFCVRRVAWFPIPAVSKHRQCGSQVISGFDGGWQWSAEKDYPRRRSLLSLLWPISTLARGSLRVEPCSSSFLSQYVKTPQPSCSWLRRFKMVGREGLSASSLATLTPLADLYARPGLASSRTLFSSFLPQYVKTPQPSCSWLRRFKMVGREGFEPSKA